MSRVRLVVGALGASGVIAGALLFPHAYEPGRTEHDGPSTPLVVSGRLDANTWTPRPSGGVVRVGDGRLVIRATGRGTMLVSRTLAVYPRRCYRLTVRGAAGASGALVIVTDERDTFSVVQLTIPQGRRLAVVSAPVRSRANRRLTLSLRSSRPGIVRIAEISLRLADGASACTPSTAGAHRVRTRPAGR